MGENEDDGMRKGEKRRRAFGFARVSVVVCTHWHIAQSGECGCWSDLGQTPHLSQRKAKGSAQKLVPVCQQRKPEDWDALKCHYFHFNPNLFFSYEGMDIGVLWNMFINVVLAYYISNLRHAN